MKYDEDKDRYTLSTGREFYANRGILGLSPETDTELFDGYDSTVREAEPDDYSGDLPFTRGERREVAQEMIRRWQTWAERGV